MRHSAVGWFMYYLTKDGTIIMSVKGFTCNEFTPLIIFIPLNKSVFTKPVNFIPCNFYFSVPSIR